MANTPEFDRNAQGQPIMRVHSEGEEDQSAVITDPVHFLHEAAKVLGVEITVKTADGTTYDLPATDGEPGDE